MNRYLSKIILSDLKKKMVFIGGPRQVGKTTFSQQVCEENFNNFEYFNYDYSDDRKKILEEKFSPDSEILIFDEIHKYKNWKNFIKGIFDVKKDDFKFLITGSARLDLYKKGGDSMLGRYHYHRLHPFSLAEILGFENNFDDFDKNFKFSFEKNQKSEKILNELFDFGGFPEPFFEKDKIFLHRWQNERRNRLVKEDIRDLELIREFSIFQILIDLIESKVASVFSINSLREDLQVSHQTISKWMDILDNFYYTYRVYPFSPKKIKSVKKEPKVYLWDYSEVKNEGARFENLIASHLLKFTHFLYDSFGINIELNYIRDFDGREIDFCLTLNGEIFALFEVKNSDEKISKHLKYFKKKLEEKSVPGFQCFQILKKSGVDFEKDGIRVISADKFLTGLV